MEFKLFQYVLPLAMFVSCSDSSEVIPDVPEKLTFDKYEIACFEPSTKKDPVDTLFVSPMAAVSDFDVTSAGRCCRMVCSKVLMNMYRVQK